MAKDFSLCECVILLLTLKKASARSVYAFTLAFAFAIAHKLCSNYISKLSPYVVTAFAVFLLSVFAEIWDKRIWKEAEEKILRECGIDESIIEEIRIYDRADFNSNRRFYRWTNDVAEYLEGMRDKVLPSNF